LELFARSLDARDWVALEVTGNAWAIARMLEPHVARVIVVSPSDTGIRQARAKTDRLDARTLAKLLWAGELDGVWAPDERVRAMRWRLARRAPLVRARSRAKNEIHAVLMRCLKERPPASDLFGLKGRRWLSEQRLPVCERETVDSALRQVDFLDTEIAQVDKLVAAEALSWPEVKQRLDIHPSRAATSSPRMPIGDRWAGPARPTARAGVQQSKLPGWARIDHPRLLTCTRFRQTKLRPSSQRSANATGTVTRLGPTRSTVALTRLAVTVRPRNCWRASTCVVT
jgi:hypothetical protein